MSTEKLVVQPERSPVLDDMLKGARQIGAYIGESESAVYYIFKKQKLPIGKYGKELIASKSKLDRALRALPTNADPEAA